MGKFKLMTEEQKEAIEWLRVQKEFLSDNKRDIFISESGNYPLIVDLLSETSADSINNRLSYEEAESLALGYMGRADKLIDKYLDKFKVE